MASLTSPSCTVRTVCSVSVLLTRCLHVRGSSFNTHQNLRAREDHSKDSLTRKRSVLHSLRKKLNQSPDHIVRLLELPENARLSSCEDIRIGSRGSVRVAREVAATTEKVAQGFWYNFETNESGDMLDLVRKTKKIDSDHELQLYILHEILPHLKHLPPELDSDVDMKSVNVNANQVKVGDYVNKIISELRPLKGSLAWRYLTRARGLSRIPDTPSLQFHPGLNTRTRDGGWMTGVPALVSLATHPAATTGNLQVTYLDPRTGDKHHRADIARRTFGSFQSWARERSEAVQHCCQLTPGSGGRTSVVCEGVETGLSVLQALPDVHLVATLGKNNFPRVDPNMLNKKVILVMDNDGVQQMDADVVFQTTVRKLLQSGKEVHYVLPPLLDGHKKTDMNDVLGKVGVGGVYDVITNYLQRAVCN